MRTSLQVALACLMGTIAASTSAQGSPWLPIPKSGTITFIQASQTADHFYRGTANRPLPFGELEQSTSWVAVTYGATDSLALDGRLGRSMVEAGPLGEDKGPTDMTLGLTWRFVDEDINDGVPSIAARIGVVRAGDYDVGMPHAIGDGGDGFEASVLVGKIFADQLAFSGELGLRSLDHDVPRQTIFNAAAHWVTPMPGLTVRAQYHQQRSDGDLDIGGVGFMPPRFPEVTEDIDRFSVGASYRFGPLSIGFDRFNTTGARNTGDFNAWAAAVTYRFDLFKP